MEIEFGFGYNTETFLSEATRFLCLGKAYSIHEADTGILHKAGLNHLFINRTDSGSGVFSDSKIRPRWLTAHWRGRLFWDSVLIERLSGLDFFNCAFLWKVSICMENWPLATDERYEDELTEKLQNIYFWAISSFRSRTDEQSLLFKHFLASDHFCFKIHELVP